MADSAQLKPVAKVLANLSEILVKAQQGVRCIYPINYMLLSFDKARNSSKTTRPTQVKLHQHTGETKRKIEHF